MAGVALTALGGLWWRTGFPADAVDAAALCVASVALGDIHLRFTWQAWHLRRWAGSGGAPGSQLTPWTPRLFAWQAWHLVTSTFTLRGRRGTYGTGLAHPLSLCVAGVAFTALCVAGVALGDIHLHSAWPAWHLVTIDRHFAWQV